MRFAIVGLVRGHADGDYGLLDDRNRFIARYCRKFPRPAADVIVFHQGDITRKQQRDLRARSGLKLRFRDIGARFGSWEGMCGPPEEKTPIGYCHMCKFYLVMLPRLMATMGYDYYMRLDDDSMLVSSVENIFEQVAGAGTDYAMLGSDNEWHAATLSTLPSVIDAYVRRNGLAYEWSTLAFYNNFFVTRTAAWNRPPVRKFLREIGGSPDLYRFRWGDAPLQTVAVRLFGMKVSQLRGVVYVHASHHTIIKT